jgi:hypothetical protein
MIELMILTNQNTVLSNLMIYDFTIIVGKENVVNLFCNDIFFLSHLDLNHIDEVLK